MVFMCLIPVPILVDVCPYDVAPNWTHLDPDYAANILPKEGKVLCEIFFLLCIIKTRRQNFSYS